jgi:hypothetical protein
MRLCPHLARGYSRLVGTLLCILQFLPQRISANLFAIGGAKGLQPLVVFGLLIENINTAFIVNPYWSMFKTYLSMPGIEKSDRLKGWMLTN